MSVIFLTNGISDTVWAQPESSFSGWIPRSQLSRSSRLVDYHIK
jgi:hypothetical protein